MFPLIKLIPITFEIISYIGLRRMIYDWDKKEEEKVLQILNKHEKYKDYRLWSSPCQFEGTFAGQTYLPLVQIHFAQRVRGDDIVWSAGKGMLKDGDLIPLDGASYDKIMWVIGYKWFMTENGEKGLDILVKDW